MSARRPRVDTFPRYILENCSACDGHGRHSPMLNMPEKIAVYKETAPRESATDLRLAEDLGVTGKTIGRWKQPDRHHDTKRKAPRVHEEKLQRMLRGVAEFPWSIKADQQTFVLFLLLMQKRFT